MIEPNLINLLKKSKNLLAFSAGVDSTALFFMLLEQNIDFDIALVNYNLRDQAKSEELYAKKLAKKYNKKAFTTLSPKFTSNFEANAREFRYKFFETIIKKHNYNNLLTGHQLNDKLEWLLMRLSKGSGISELSGMGKIDSKNGYKVIRPLLDFTKDELLLYLEQNSIKYFVDSSNFKPIYERNLFRPIAKELLKFGKSGFLRSFEILGNESKKIDSTCQKIYHQKSLIVAKIECKAFVTNCISKLLKELGYLISYKDRNLFLNHNSLVIGRKWAVELKNNYIFIAPYIKKVVMSKEFKQKCQRANIPPKVRGYIFKEKIDINCLYNLS